MTKPYLRLLYSTVVLTLIGAMEMSTAPALPRLRVVFLNLSRASLQQSDEKVIERNSYDNEPYWHSS